MMSVYPIGSGDVQCWCCGGWIHQEGYFIHNTHIFCVNCHHSIEHNSSEIQISQDETVVMEE